MAHPRNLLFAALIPLAACGQDIQLGPDGWSLRGDEPKESSKEPKEVEGFEEPAPLRCDGPPPPERIFDLGDDTVSMSIGVGPRGCPRVLFSQRDALHIARWVQGSWSIEQVPAFAASDDVPQYRSTLHVDSRGRETVFATSKDAPRLVALRPSKDAWIQEEVASRWVWKMRGFTDSDGQIRVLAYTADEQYSGTNMRLRVFTEQKKQQWSDEVLGEGMALQSLFYPTMASAPQSRALTLPVLENVGGKVGAYNENLSVFTVTSEGERHEKVESKELGPTSDVLLAQQTDALHLFAFAKRPYPYPGTPGPQTIAHLRRDLDTSVWQTSWLEACADVLCRPMDTFVDERQRVHLIFGRRDADLGARQMRLFRSVWSDALGWSAADEVGVFDDSVSHQVAYDPFTGVTHLIAPRYTAQYVRSAVYVAIAPFKS